MTQMQNNQPDALANMNSNLSSMKSRPILHYPAIWITLLILAILIPGIYFLHRFQLVRLENDLLNRVELAKEKGDYEEAAKFLSRYLQYKPNSAKQEVEFTELIAEKSAGSVPPANLIGMLYQSLGKSELDPTLESHIPNLREKLIDLLENDATRLGEAIEQISKLSTEERSLKWDKKLAELRFRALAAGLQDPSIGRIKDAPKWMTNRCTTDPVDHLLSSLEDHKGDITLTAMLGNACILNPKLLVKSRLAKEDSEDLKLLVRNKIQEMLAVNQDKPEAWIIDYQINSKIGQELADKHIREALEKFPEDSEVKKQGAVHFMNRLQAGREKGNKAVIEEAVEKAKAILGDLRQGEGLRSTFTYLSLYELYMADQESEKALQSLEDGIRVCLPPITLLHVKRVEHFNDTGNFEKAKTSLTSMDEEYRKEAPTFTALVQSELSRSMKEQYLRYYSGVGDLVSVSKQLDDLVVGTASSDSTTELRIQAFAAENFRKIGYWEKAANAYMKALALSPNQPNLRRGAAECLVKLNRSNEASEQYRLIERKTYVDWVQLARLELIQQTKDVTFANAQWDRIQKMIDQATELANAANPPPADRWMIDLLQAELDVRKTDPAKQREVVDVNVPKIIAICEANPDAEYLWFNSIGLLSFWGEFEESKKLQNAYSARNPNSPDALLAQTTEMVNEGKRDEARKMMLEKLPNFPPNARLIQSVIGLTRLDADYYPTIQRLLEYCKSDFSAVSDLCENLLRIPQFSGELADDKTPEVLKKTEIWDSGMVLAENRLKQLEGDSGIQWRYVKARRSLVKSRFDDRPDFSTVMRLLSEIEASRPDWSQLYILNGILNEQLKEPSKAILAYQAAISLGSDDLKVFERLIELLYRDGRFEEAENYIAKLGVVSNLSNRISSVALRLSERNRSNTLDIARAGVDARPFDPQAWIWYSRVLESSSREMTPENRETQLQLAEQALERARNIDPKGLEPVKAYFQHYALTRQRAKIEELVSKVHADDSMQPATERWMTLGTMYMFLNDLQMADSCFSQAQAAGGPVDRIGILKAEVLNKLGKRNEAIEIVLDLAQKRPEQKDIRHFAAVMLGQRNNPDDWASIERILTSPPFGNMVDDKLLFARLLMDKKTYVDLEKARTILQGLVNLKNRSTSDVIFSLGLVNRNLYDMSTRDQAVGKDLQLYKDSAESALKTAANSTPPDELKVATYMAFLLDQKRVDDANSFMDKLVAIAPKSRSTYALRALLKTQKDSQPAADIINEWLDSLAGKYENPRDFTTFEYQDLAFAGMMFEIVNDDQQAIKVLDTLIERKTQEAKLYLLYLLRHELGILRNIAMQRIVQKFDELEFTPQDIMSTLLISLSLPFDESAVNAFKQRLEKLMDTPEAFDPTLARLIGDFYLVRNDYPGAKKAYAALVAAEPENVVALNNLANILIELGPDNAQQALELINRAIALMPNEAPLLDSKGCILITLKRYDEAAKALELATAKGGDPRSALHWYIALTRGGRKQEAEKVKSRINVKALRDVHLSPDDKQELSQLQ